MNLNSFLLFKSSRDFEKVVVTRLVIKNIQILQRDSLFNSDVIPHHSRMNKNNNSDIYIFKKKSGIQIYEIIIVISF